MSYNGGYCPHGKMWSSRCEVCGPGAYEMKEKKMQIPNVCEHGLHDYMLCAACVGVNVDAMQQEANAASPRNKYVREIKPYNGEGEPILIDVYSVIEAFKVTDGGLQHALKKILMPGARGSKGVIQDLDEAIVSVQRAIVTEKMK